MRRYQDDDPLEEMTIEEEREAARQDMRDFERKSGHKLPSRARPKCQDHSPHTGAACVKSLGHGDDHAAGFPEDMNETWKRDQAIVRHLKNNTTGGPLCGQDSRVDLGPEHGPPCMKCKQKLAREELKASMTPGGPLLEVERVKDRPKDALRDFRLTINGRCVIDIEPQPTHGSLDVVRAKFKAGKTPSRT